MLNLHTHTIRCGHAAGTDREYIEAAIRAGYTEMGFADHSPIDFRAMFEGRPSLDKEQVFRYAEELGKLKEEYAEDIAVHIGFETEFYTDIFEDNLSCFREAGIEYLIQGQHYSFLENGKTIPSAAPVPDEAFLTNYLELLKGGIRSGAFTYIAHPDLINFTGDESFYLRSMREFLEYVKAAGTQIEFNFLGYVTHRNYPDPRFLRIVSELSIPVSIGLDAHDPAAYGQTEELKKAFACLRELGITAKAPVIRPIS